MKRALIRLTLKALHDAMRLTEDEEIIGVFRNEEDLETDTMSVLIRGKSERIPEVAEGCQIPYIGIAWEDLKN